MFGIQNYGSFIIAVVLFQLFPGAGTITILNATARKGVRGGMKAVFGTLSGDFTYMFAAVLGLSAALGAYPSILVRTQWIGVAYLCWIGFKLIRTSATTQSADMETRKEDWAHFRQALAVSLTNPKVIMFFMAFFPLFLSEKSTPITLLALMVHVTAISFLIQTGLVIVGNTIATRLYTWQFARLVATRLAGIALIGFGAKLAIMNR
ncbi:LysE family transporter [Desulfobacterales bacterium HSG17]|nr:LysE family transporter [Desulfobacterales bacterium HSG17]